jgi:hypothetical protein
MAKDGGSTAYAPPHRAPGAEELRRAREVLEAVVSDRSLLARLPIEERTRLLTAAGRAVHPDTE